MLDIQFIRDNRELVKEKSKQKGYQVEIDHLLELDTQVREKLSTLEQLRQKRNLLSASFSSDLQPSDDKVEEGKNLKTEIVGKEQELNTLSLELEMLLKNVPNMPAEDVPIGESEDDNQISKVWGEKPEFNFKPRTHWQIAELYDLIDKQRAAKVSGSRFAYIKGNLVRLQFAIVQFVLSVLTDEVQLQKIINDNDLRLSPKPFVPILPPAMIKTEVFEAMDRLEPKDDRYKVGADEDNLWLQGSAEHTLGSMYIDETLNETDLPIRYVGYLTSFRREAGTYGKDTEGIIRMHQFDKLEMETFSNAELGEQEHNLMVGIQEFLVQQLQLPYQLLNKCTADIGKPNSRGIDLEVWMPGQDRYVETHTADYMTDYQTRRLKTRYRPELGGQLMFVHSNDATAFALGRIMAAIMENYQTSDGFVRIPEILIPYMSGVTKL